MRILYITTLFPKAEKSSTIYTDLAEELANRGHSVTVFAATQDSEVESIEFVEERGCEIYRIKTPKLYNVGFFRKGIAILLLPIMMRRALKLKLNQESFELILFESPPLTLFSVVNLAKKMFKAKTFLMLKDIFPQNAVDIEILSPKSIIYHLFKYQENKLYEVSDMIGCMSRANLEYLLKHSDISRSKTCIFPNTKKLTPYETIEKLVRNNKFNLPQEKVIFLFGGNMGKPQGIPFLVEAIKFSSRKKEAHFVLVGRGTEKDYLKRELCGLDNVTILDELSRGEYDNLVKLCHVGIISLDYRFTIPNYPSRILSYMDYSLPVLALIDSNTDYSDLIDESGCGYWCFANSIDDFYDKLSILCDNPRNRVIMGKNGRNYLEDNLTVDKSVDILEKYMLEGD